MKLRRCAVCASALVGLVVFEPAAAMAQPADFRAASAGYEYELPVTLPNGLRVGTHVVRADLAFPFAMADKATRFVPSTRYELTDVVPTPATPADALRLHLLSISATLLHRFDDRWGAAISVGGGIASQLAEPLGARDVFVVANAVGSYRFSSTFTLGAGIAYDGRTGTVTPLPLGAFYWEPVPGFSIRGLIPADAYVSWRAARAVTLEVVGTLEGERYHLSEARFGGRTASLAYSLLKAGPGVRLHLGRLTHVEVVAGAVLRRRYEVFVDDASQGTGATPIGAFLGLNAWVGGSGWQDDAPPTDEGVKPAGPD